MCDRWWKMRKTFVERAYFPHLLVSKLQRSRWDFPYKFVSLSRLCCVSKIDEKRASRVTMVKGIRQHFKHVSESRVRWKRLARSFTFAWEICSRFQARVMNNIYKFQWFSGRAIKASTRISFFPRNNKEENFRSQLSSALDEHTSALFFAAKIYILRFFI